MTDTAMAIRLVEGGFRITLASPLMAGLVNPAPTSWISPRDDVSRHIVAIPRSGDRDKPAAQVVLEQLREVTRRRGMQTSGARGAGRLSAATRSEGAQPGHR